MSSKRNYLTLFALVLMLLLGIFIFGCTGSTELPRETTTTTISTSTTTLSSTTTTSLTTTMSSTTTTTLTSTTSTSTTTSSSTTTTATTTTTTITLTYSVSGKVCFASTTDGVKNVESVGIFNGSFQKITTPDAANGNYVLSGIPAGSYTLLASKEGWETSQESVTITNSNLTDVNFALSPISWEVISVGLFPTLEDIASMEDSSNPLKGIIFAVGGNGVSSIIIASEDGGNTGVPINSPTTETLVSVQDGASLGVIIANLSSGVFTTIDAKVSGTNWNYLGNVTTETIAAIKFFAPNAWDIVTANGKLIRTTDGGGSYSDITPSSMFVNDVATYGTNIYVVGNSGMIKYSTNAGASWNDLTLTPPTTDDLMAIYYRLGSDKGILVTRTGKIYIKAGPSEPTVLDLDGIPYELRGCYMPPAGPPYSFVVGQNGLVMRRK